MDKSKDFQEFRKIHEEELKSVQNSMAFASDKVNIGLGEVIAAQCFHTLSRGNVVIEFKEDGPTIEINCTRAQAIFCAYELLQATHEDIKGAFSSLAGFELYTRVDAKMNKKIQRTVIDESKMSKEQVEVAKVMAEMSPEDLAKLKEQMNE
jgi:hypothetical protein